METIGIRELRQNASVYLRQVENGATFCITDRGTPVGVLFPPGPLSAHITRDLLEGLVAAGVYPDVESALADGSRRLARELRHRLVDELVVEGYRREPQVEDRWLDAATSTTLRDLDW
jgi:prevent-host-death family protein